MRDKKDFEGFIYNKDQRRQWIIENKFARIQNNINRFIALFSFVAASGAAVAAYYAVEANYQNRRQADAAISGVRVWIDIGAKTEKARVVWRTVNNDFRDLPVVYVPLYVTNIGNSPALSVTIFEVLAVRKLVDRNFIKQQCSRGSFDPAGDIIFSKDTFEQPTGTDALIEDMNIQYRRWRGMNPVSQQLLPSYIHLNLILCARYRLMGDEQLHYTGRSYDVLKRGANPIRVGEAVDIGGVVLDKTWHESYID